MCNSLNLLKYHLFTKEKQCSYGSIPTKWPVVGVVLSLPACMYSGFEDNTIVFRHTNELRNYSLVTPQRKFFICSFEYGLFLVLQDSWCLGLLDVWDEMA